jgi:VIT1/CCC1 family predicted Fe2+/Mn2+ transporter
MPEDPTKPAKRLLEPVERISEVLFGLIMVLTITCSFSVVEAGHKEVRQMLIAALGCNLAWGIIDAVFYLMTCFSERGQGIRTLQAVRKATEPSKAHGIIADALPPLLASVLSTAEFEMMRQKLRQLPEQPTRPRLIKSDWLAACGVFLIVFLSTFPVVIPFTMIPNPRLALHVSNGVAVVMLFLAGYQFGRYAGLRPWRMALAMVAVSGALVGVTIALGG